METSTVADVGAGEGMEPRHVRDGVVYLREVIPAHLQATVCAQLLQAAHGPTTLGFLPFAHLRTFRLSRERKKTPSSTRDDQQPEQPEDDPAHEQKEEAMEKQRPEEELMEKEEGESKWGEVETTGDLRELLAQLSARLHERLYGQPDGLWAGLPENGCSEDHEGRRCQCPDRTPLMPRSTELNCVEGLIYRAGSRRDYHRDAHWMMALSFGCEVQMGFHREDDQQPVVVTVPSGDAVLFNGALHSHAVLGIGEASSAPSWWSYPFARTVFLMRDARQTIRARKRLEARRAAAAEAGKAAAMLASARLSTEE